MASTYSDRLKLELMATGANANTWGTNTNNNLDVIDAFAAGYLSKSVAGSSNITLTTANASDTAEASNKVIELTGALTGDIVVFIPAVESNYTFFNNTTGSQTLTIAATGHQANGTLITQGAHTTVYCDGASNYNVEISSSTDAAALNAGTLADARFPATLPAASGVNLTSLNASNLGSGTVPDARFPATLPAADGSALTALNATNIASGTLGSDRLPTVPTTKGGTGLTAIGTAGQVLTVNSGASALEFADAAGGGVGNSTLTTFTSSATFTPNADSQFVSVRAVGGGGGGKGGAANGYPAPNAGNPGGVSSFGNLISGTGGSFAGSGGTAGGNLGAITGAGGDAGQGGTNGPNVAGGTGGYAGTLQGNPIGRGGAGGRSYQTGGPSGPGGGGGGAVFAVVSKEDYTPSIAVTVGAGGTGSPRNNQLSQNANPGASGATGQVDVLEFLP